MQRIRGEQVQAFEKAGVQRFEVEMIAHLKGYSPGHAKVLGDEGLLKVIRFGTERAARYGLTFSGPIRLYIELIFQLGSEFDTDPQYPWAGEIFAKSNATNQMVEADRLFDATLKYLDATAGEDREWARASLRWARHEPYEGLPLNSPSWMSESLARLRRISPQKCDYVGAEALQRLLGKALDYSRKQGITSGNGVALVGALMFSAGHGFYADPHLPWIETTLSRSADDPNQRMDRLHAKLMAYLDRVIATMPQG